MKRKISLVLGAGGSKGLAHLGVIKALNEAGFEITQIAGTSVGALIGGLYAGKPDVKWIEEIVYSLSYRKLSKIILERPRKSALIYGNNYHNFLKKILPIKNVEDTQIPFRAVASDLVSGEKYVFNSGPLVTAISASSAIPAIFSPVEYKGMLLIDGGAIDPVPVDEIEKNEKQPIVAVALYKNLFPKDFSKLKKAGLARIAFDSMQVTVSNLSKKAIKKADLVILPDVENINVLDFVKAKEYVEIGYRTMKKNMDQLNKLYE
ncbi:MAG: patatin-like phospholipase family protein [Candidatus Shapirobacteria bacterium]